MSLLYDASAYPNEVSPVVVDAIPPYLGFDVLPVTHNMREAISESFSRRGELVAGATGARVFDDRGRIAFPRRTFLWTALDRASCNALRTFLDARKGRLVPFWVPTCCWDLRLAVDALDVASTLTIRRTGYLDFLFGANCRGYLAIFPPGGTMLIRKVNSGASIDQATEQIVLDAPLGVGIPAAGTVISFLVLCRLADDLVRIRWIRTWACEASIPFVELPREVPA